MVFENFHFANQVSLLYEFWHDQIAEEGDVIILLRIPRPRNNPTLEPDSRFFHYYYYHHHSSDVTSGFCNVKWRTNVHQRLWLLETLSVKVEGGGMLDWSPLKFTSKLVEKIKLVKVENKSSKDIMKNSVILHWNTEDEFLSILIYIYRSDIPIKVEK